MDEGQQRTGRKAESQPQGYPWALEREAFEALDGLEVDRCQTLLYRMADQLRLPAEAPQTVLAVLLSEVLALLAARLQPGSSEAGSEGAARRDERIERAERIGTADGLPELRAAFLHEIDSLFAPLASSAGLSPGVLRARAFLDRHFARRVSLQELAEAVHLSPNYLSSIFRRETGMTVTEYLRRRRTQRAEQLLLEGRHTISEVAYLVGFQNYRDFHRNFVRAGGRSPRAFQRLCRSRRHSLRTRPAAPRV